MNLTAVLNELERLEKAVAHLYGWFARVFHENEEVAAFFERMRTQELGHANSVRLERRLTHADPATFAPVEIDLEPVRELIASIEEFRSRDGPPTIGQALLFAMQVESHAAERLHRQAVAQSNPELASLVTNLARSDREHFALLKEFANQHAWAFETM